MLKSIIGVAVPAMVFLAMSAVGVGLTVADLRRAARRRGLVAAATVGQAVCLPLIALALVGPLGLSPSLAKGMLLVAACPAGSMANLYNYLARADVALSVTLTAVSSLAGVLTLPIVTLCLQQYLGEQAEFNVPAQAVVGNLVLTLLLPILTGMGVRRLWPAVAERHQRGLLALSIGLLIAVIGLIVAHEAGHIAAEIGQVAVAVAALTGLALAAGWTTGWAGGVGATARFTVGVVFAVRNVGIATALAVTALGQVEFAGFATAYFLAQAPLLLTVALAHRGMRVVDGTHPDGTNLS
jgi:bile acid:Na+ symporter, BASS family